MGSRVNTIEAKDERVPMCGDCLAAGHAGSEPDFPWRPMRIGEACGAADHDETVRSIAVAGEAERAPAPTLDEARAAVFALGTHLRARFLEREDVIEGLMAALVAREHVLLLGEPGCIGADSEVIVNRAGNSRRMSVARLVHLFNGGETGGYGAKREWDPSIPTHIQMLGDDGFGRLGTVVRALCSGVKRTWRIHTETGRTIQATHDHPFNTPTGWRRLEELRVGSPVLALRPPERGARQSKRRYAQVEGMDNHPFVDRANMSKSGRRHRRVPLHRLVMEAHLSGLSLVDFIDRIRDGSVEGLTFLDPALVAVHHKDRDPGNNTVNNLAALTHAEHARLHASEDGIGARMLWAPAEERVVRIEEVGDVETYDLSIKEAAHNFTANGFVVHNTAKSELALAVCEALDGRFFQTLCTRFQTPDEVLGLFSLRAMQEDRYIRRTANRIPEADVAFLDEVFKGSSAMLNTLLRILNERAFEQDGVVQRIPLRLVVAASNELPDEGDGLGAFHDRFLVRFDVRRLQHDEAARTVLFGDLRAPAAPRVTPAQLDLLAAAADAVQVSQDAQDAVLRIRAALHDKGVRVSDRRWRKAVGLLRAEAALAGRGRATSAHLGALEHCLWERIEQIPAVREVVRANVATWIKVTRDGHAAIDEQIARIQEAGRRGGKRHEAIGQLAKSLDALVDTDKVLEELLAGHPESADEVAKVRARIGKAKQDVNAAMRVHGIGA